MHHYTECRAASTSCTKRYVVKIFDRERYSFYGLIGLFASS